jgi:hypothetical protein
MMAMQDSRSLAAWTHVARVWALVIVCASCELMDPSPTGDPPGALADAAAAVDGRIDASDVARDASLDAQRPAVDAVPDFSLDSELDTSSDATAPGDQSVTDDGRDAGDGASSDAVADSSSSDQQGTIDGPDADAKPRSPTCTVDQPCVGGDCIGESCDQAWQCFSHFAPHPCPFDTIPYCGCDGKTYYFPLTCSEVPYEHAGACGDGSNCDEHDVRCTQPPPDCGPDKVPSVVGTCYGPCVDITECRCVFSFECPKRDLYSCRADLRCGL